MSRPGNQERGGEIDFENRAPVREADDIDGSDTRFAGEMHDVIDTTELTSRLRQTHADRSLIGNIETLGHEARFAARNRRDCQVGREHTHAALAEHRHRGQAKAAGRASDKCNLRLTAHGAHAKLRGLKLPAGA